MSLKEKRPESQTRAHYRQQRLPFPLCEAPALPASKQEELSLALVELLLCGATTMDRVFEDEAGVEDDNEDHP